MIPSPKLDDRTFNDIVEEAIGMIPRYAPEWTNHNPSDPGITLIELSAWMTDLILHRLNQVPEKNYVAFLNLLGIKLRPPRAAKAFLQFALVDGAQKQRVPKGTQVSTPQATEEETVTFETPTAASRISTTRTATTRAFSSPAPRAASKSSAAPSASIASCTCPTRASPTPATRACSACSSAAPSAATAISRACSSGSTGTATAGAR